MSATVLVFMFGVLFGIIIISILDKYFSDEYKEFLETQCDEHWDFAMRLLDEVKELRSENSWLKGKLGMNND